MIEAMIAFCPHHKSARGGVGFQPGAVGLLISIERLRSSNCWRSSLFKLMKPYVTYQYDSRGALPADDIGDFRYG
jgi:hypothetical protein